MHQPRRQQALLPLVGSLGPAEGVLFTREEGVHDGVGVLDEGRTDLEEGNDGIPEVEAAEREGEVEEAGGYICDVEAFADFALQMIGNVARVKKLLLNSLVHL